MKNKKYWDFIAFNFQEQHASYDYNSNDADPAPRATWNDENRLVSCVFYYFGKNYYKTLRYVYYNDECSRVIDSQYSRIIKFVTNGCTCIISVAIMAHQRFNSFELW